MRKVVLEEPRKDIMLVSEASGHNIYVFWNENCGYYYKLGRLHNRKFVWISLHASIDYFAELKEFDTVQDAIKAAYKVDPAAEVIEFTNMSDFAKWFNEN